MHLLTKVSLPFVLGASVFAWPYLSETSSRPLPNVDLAPAKGGSLVKPLTANEVAKASETIDRMITEELTKRGINALPTASDEVYIRRVYLDLIGRIPTLAETEAFLSSRKSNKREQLVKTLIGSDGYMSHQFNYWADLLRATTRMQNRYPGQPYIDYIKQSLRDNKPYDIWVSEMLQAEGPALARGNGATGYYIRDAGMPLDNMSNTVQVFLGTQLACAQCHNHPTDKWSRMDYFQMAAFTSGVSVSRNYNGEAMMKRDPAMRDLRKEIAAAPPQLRNAVRRYGETVGLTIRDSDSDSIKLPADYQYADAKGGSKVNAHPMFGELPSDKVTNPRAAYASWMVAQERFALVIANRMWKQAMGRGLIEPVDNLKDDTVASNPALMDYLTRLMVAVKFDLQKFQIILYTTEAYQRDTLRQDLEEADYAYQGRLLKRLTAEQVWDSLMALAVENIDKHKGLTADSLHELYDDKKDLGPKEVFELAKQQTDNREAAMALRKDFDALRAKIKTTKDPAARASIIKQLQELAERRDELMAKSDPIQMKLALGAGKGRGARDSKMGQGNLLRASEVASPAPGNHFLHTFGQSDRQLIDNGNTDAAVTQALSLMNGMVEVDLLSNRSVLYGNVVKASGAEAKAEALWMTILSRKPTSAEKTMAMRLIAIDAKGSFDLAWALINSREFLFVR